MRFVIGMVCLVADALETLLCPAEVKRVAFVANNKGYEFDAFSRDI